MDSQIVKMALKEVNEAVSLILEPPKNKFDPNISSKEPSNHDAFIAWGKFNDSKSRADKAVALLQAAIDAI